MTLYKSFIILGILTLMLGIWILNTYEKLVIYNPTPSVPIGFYHYAGQELELGKVVLFKTPEVVKQYTLKNHGTEGFEYFLKPILAKEDDHLCFKENQFFLNGEVFANVKRLDSNGNVLPVWKGCRKLTKNEIFVYSDRVGNSFDSRYYGPIKVSTVIGVFKKI